VLPPTRSPLPSASGGLWALGCVGEWWIFDRRCRLDTRYRGRSPGGGREVETAPSWWNKVLLALSHLVVTCSSAGGGPVRSGLTGSGDRVRDPYPVGSCVQESCRRWLVVSVERQGRWPFASWMRWLLWVCWKLGGWIGLKLPAAAIVVISELRPMIQGARGVTPADGRSATVSSRLSGRVSSAASFKAFV
jgi:hypothetical protein